MKQKSKFDEPRPEMFRALLKANTGELLERFCSAKVKRSTVTIKGKKVSRTSSGQPAYIGGATRKRVRALAREMARDEMRSYRRTQKEQAA